MSCLWYVGQTGILIEIAGASLGVWFAWQTRAQWLASPPEATYDSIGADLARPRAEFIGQFGKQMAVFALLGVGLILQLIGNFAGWQ